MWSIPPTFSKYKHLWRVASWLCLAGSGGLKARRGTEAGGDLLGHSLLGDALCSCMSVLVFQKFQAKIDQDRGIGQRLGTARGKVNKDELRYYTTEWCCINTAGCSGLQFDPCSLIPRNRLFSAIAFCSRFVYWIICHYTCSQWSTMFFVSPLLYWLQLPLSPSGQPKDDFHQYAVCSHFFPSRARPGKSNKRWFAWLQCLMICDSILFGTHPMYLLASVYTCLHTWFFVSSVDI